MDRYFEYCSYGCKYEDTCGFCTLTSEQRNPWPEDAFCWKGKVERKDCPDYLVPVRYYKELKAKKEYGFR